jgi:hypothetical protein
MVPVELAIFLQQREVLVCEVVQLLGIEEVVRQVEASSGQ